MTLPLAATAVRLPAPKQLRDLLEDLLDREVEIRPTTPFGVHSSYPASVATYVDDALAVRALVALDLPLSAYVGAAVADVPAARAVAAIDAGRVTGVLADGVRAMFDRVPSILETSRPTALRPLGYQLSGEPLPQDVCVRSQGLGHRCDVLVRVAGFGAGRVAIVLV